MTRRLLLVLGFAATLAALAATGARADTTATGTLGGAPYEIKVPTNWNGTLLVYAHGYSDKADHPGETDDRTAHASPNAALDTFLLGQGYALAGSAYADNGWAVKEGIHDTRLLATYFNGRFGKPSETLLWGFSMGSVVALAEAEQANGIFDGYLAACAVAAGTPRAWDGALLHLLAYKVAFGMPNSWGTPGNVRDDLDFDTEVLPKIFFEAINPLNFGKFEFIRLVTQVAGPGTIPPPASWFPGGFFTNMFFLTEAKAELERTQRIPRRATTPSTGPTTRERSRARCSRSIRKWTRWSRRRTSRRTRPRSRPPAAPTTSTRRSRAGRGTATSRDRSC